MRRKLFLAIALALLAFPALAPCAAVDPAEDWRTVATPHFYVHYPARLAPLAARLAEIAERNHAKMTALAGWAPSDPVEVVLSDEADLANGSATVLGRNTIVVNAAQPETGSTISSHPDWLELVFVHEYAHILTLDYRRGYAKVTEAIFGRVEAPFTIVSGLFWLAAVPPNGLLPPWAVEGMAVDFETGVTGGGRRDSTWYATVYRAAVAEDAIPPLDRLGGDYPGYASYDTRYIFGARLMSTAAGEKGLENLGLLARENGGRFPFFIEAAARRASGKSYPELYGAMVAGLKAEYLPEIERIRGAGLTHFTELTGEGFAHGAPRWKGDGELLWTEDAPNRAPELKAIELSTGMVRTVAERAGNLTRPTVTPEGVAFTSLTNERPWAGPLLRNALYTVREGCGCAPEKITDGLRVRYADSSPDGSRFAAVLLDGTNQRLSLLSGEEGKLVERVLLAEPNARYDDPRVSPDARTIAFTRKAAEGGERLALIPAEGGAAELLTSSSSRSLSPSWSPDGKHLVFSSDREGVFNLWTIEVATGKTRRLTNVVGGAFAPDWSPDGKRIAFLSYSARGFDLAVAGAVEAKAEGDPLPREALIPPPAEPEPPKGSTPYSALGYLAPVWWLPDVQVDNAGAVYGAWTSARDPLNTLGLVAGGFWSKGNERPYGVAALTYDGWYPTVTLSAWKTPLLYAGLLGPYDWWEESRGAALDVRQFLHGAQSTYWLAFGWRIEETARLSRIEEDLDGLAHLADLPFLGRKDAFYAEAGADTTPSRSSLFNVAPEGGRQVSLTYTLRDGALGSDLDTRELKGYWREYLALPWPERWVFSLTGRGGIGEGDETLQSLFQCGGEAGDFPLRGYPYRALRAEKLGEAGAELALPLWSPYRGVGDNPAYLMRLDTAAFAEAARAWETPTGTETRRAAGAELRFAGLLGYYAPTVVTLGYAKGFDEDGENRWYLLVAVGGQTILGNAPKGLNGVARRK